MTDSITASANGKLLLLGEYAVTEGATALVSTIDRAARVSITPLATAEHLVQAPDINPDPLPFSLSNKGIEWLVDGVENMGLFETSLGVFMASFDRPLASRGFSFRLDTREFFDSTGHTKLGLGSSAALSVALQRALHRCFVNPDQDLPVQQQFDRAAAAHRQFQNGLGSGVDIAASVIDGTLAYRPTPDQHLQARTLSWPDGLKVALVWTGKSASTRAMLQDLYAWKALQPRQYANTIGRLCELSEAGVEAFEANQSGQFLEYVDKFSIALDRMGKLAGIDIFSQPHRELAQLARAQKLIYKPSGAGGGDFGIAMGIETAAIATFRKQCAANGYDCPAIKISR